MAPRKRKAEDGEDETDTVAVRNTRVTRSMGRGSNEVASKKVKEKAAPAKTSKKGGGKPKKQIVEPETDLGEENVLNDSKVLVEASKEDDHKIDDMNVSDKTVVVEHCKQCNSFKTRAVLVKDGLEKVPGVTVIVNPDKPRRGCFEIREEGGEKFVSLLDMKRPFKPMKDLDMEQVIADIVDKIKG